MSDGKTFKRAQRLKDVRGFGIDRLADAADARARDDWPVLRHGEPRHRPAAPARGDPRDDQGPRDAGGQQLAAVHRRSRPARRRQRLPGRAHRPPLRPRARDPHHQRRHRGDPRRHARHRRPGRRGAAHRPHVRRHRQPRAAGRRQAPPRALPRRGRRVAARPRRLRRRGGHPPRPRRADEPVACRPAPSSRTTSGRRSRTSSASTRCRCSTTRRWSACCSTAARSSTRCTSTAWPTAP